MQVKHKRHGFNSWIREIPWRRVWQPTPVFLPGESHGQMEPGRLQSIKSQRVRQYWSNIAHMHAKNTYWASQVVLVVKNLLASTGDVRDMDSIPGLGRSPGGGHGNPLQYSCLENPMDRQNLAGYSPYGFRIRHNWCDLACTYTHTLFRMSSGGGILVTKSCPILVILWTVACQVPLSMRFPRQEYWGSLLFPSPGDLLGLANEPSSPLLQADSLPT